MSPKKILVVEDEPDLRKLIAERIEDAGYVVYTAADGQEALSLCKAHKPDLVVSDVIMPKMDGNQFMKELRKTEHGKNTPFIMLTARTLMREYFEVIGSCEFIEKPFNPDELLTCIRKILIPDVSVEPVSRKPMTGWKKDELIMEEEIVEKDSGASPLDMELAGQQPEASSSVQSRKNESLRWKTSKKKILIVDDNKVSMAVLQQMLGGLGFEAHGVGSVAVCYQEVETVNLDLIIARNEVQGLDAQDFAFRLKKMPRTHKVPILIYQNIGTVSKQPDGSSPGLVLNEEGRELLKKVLQILS